MNYKIKVDVMQNCKSRYYPLVKKHWWCRWENIAKDDPYPWCDSKEDAERRINTIIASQITHTYEIPYKEET